MQYRLWRAPSATQSHYKYWASKKQTKAMDFTEECGRYLGYQGLNF